MSQLNPQHSQPRQQEDKKLDPSVDTSSYIVVEQKIEEIIKDFDASVGTELVEIVRTKLAWMHTYSTSIKYAVLCTYVLCMQVHTYVPMYVVCMYECMYICIYVCCIYVCMHVCMYVHMYVCMYVHT